MFYIYEHRRLDNNNLFYIGKGKDDRAYSIKDRSAEWRQVYSEAGGRKIEIVFQHENEDVVLAYERFLIKTAIIWGEELVNKTFGGEGKSGRICSEAQKEHLRKINTGKHHSAATKAKLRQRSADPKWAAKHRAATKAAMDTDKTKQRHHEKQIAQYKPVIGTNIKTGEKIFLEYTSQDPRFDPTMIRACILGKNGRKQHKGYSWEYAQV
jgi:hypothetical protein